MDEKIKKDLITFERLVLNDYHKNEKDILITDLVLQHPVLGNISIESLTFDDLDEIFEMIRKGELVKRNIDVTVYKKDVEVDRILFSLTKGLVDLKTPDPLFTPLPVRSDEEESIYPTSKAGEKDYR